LSTGLAGLANQRAGKPNIILVMADDQGWGDMGYNNHPMVKTPNFDEMARTGLCFNQFYAAAPLSSPTRGSVLTGRNPNRFGVFKFGEPIRPQEKMLPKELKSAGYITGHFGKWHLGSVLEGSPVNPGACGFDEWLSAPNFFDLNPILCREGRAVQTSGEGSMITVDAAIGFIHEHYKQSNPFFAVVWFGSPHAPYQANDEDKAKYEGLEGNLQNYYGEITAMDRAFGKLRNELKILGIEKNTILWYCSDNGGVRGVSESGGRGFKQQIYEGGLRVPAILEWPGRLHQPRETNIPCYTCDIYPTLLEIANVSIRDQPILDGISLLPLIDDKIAKRMKPIGFWQYPDGGKVVPSDAIMLELLKNQEKGISKVEPESLDLDAGKIDKKYPIDIFPGHSAWLVWPFKLHRIQEKTGSVKFELYNLMSDKMEKDDISHSDSVRFISMRKELEGWLFSVVQSLNGEDYKTRNSPK
jgi:arylsulfatase A-like enzyme